MDEEFHAAANGLRPFSDFEWYACDRRGQIALFTSAGLGAIPLTVFRSKPGYYTVRDFFEALEPRGSCRVEELGRRMLDPATWVEMACRGLYAYDWDCDRGQYQSDEPYRRVACPEHPLTLDAVPVVVREWLRPVCFEMLEFAGAMDLLVEEAFAELNL